MICYFADFADENRGISLPSEAGFHQQQVTYSPFLLVPRNLCSPWWERLGQMDQTTLRDSQLWLAVNPRKIIVPIRTNYNKTNKHWNWFRHKKIKYFSFPLMVSLSIYNFYTFRYKNINTFCTVDCIYQSVSSWLSFLLICTQVYPLQSVVTQTQLILICRTIFPSPQTRLFNKSLFY